MDLEHIVTFNLALLAALASPGPAFLYALRATLGGGRAAGVATGCGLAVMAAAWTLMALMGLDGLFRLFPWAYAAFKTLGAAYLIYLAWRTWRGAGKPAGESPRPRARAFLGGVLVNLANPKSVLFAAAVLVVIFPPGLGMAEKAIIASNHLAVEIVAYSAIALLLSTPPVGRTYLRAKPALDRITAAILGGLGVRLMINR
jgi:threonine/homoserine/homoserine lactone efflux protein